MSRENRDSFKIVAACSLALVAIAATCAFCVRSAASDKKMPDEKELFADCLVSLLADYDYIVENESKEHSPTILRQIKRIEVWPDDKDPNKITVTISIPINKEDIPKWVERTDRRRSLQRRPRGPWPVVVIGGTWPKSQVKYEDGFHPSGMRAVTVSLSNNNVVEKESLRPGCLVDVIAESKLGQGDNKSSATSTTLLRKVQVIAISDQSGDSKAVNVTLKLTEQQAEALGKAMINGTILLRVIEPLTKS